jgi:hypothetical protein
VFTDEGFFIPSTGEYKDKFLAFYGNYGKLPYKVEVVRFVL